MKPTNKGFELINFKRISLCFRKITYSWFFLSIWFNYNLCFNKSNLNWPIKIWFYDFFLQKKLKRFFSDLARRCSVCWTCTNPSRSRPKRSSHSGICSPMLIGIFLFLIFQTFQLFFPKMIKYVFSPWKLILSFRCLELMSLFEKRNELVKRSEMVCEMRGIVDDNPGIFGYSFFNFIH